MKHMMIEGGWDDLLFLDDLHDMFHITNAKILACYKERISLYKPNGPEKNQGWFSGIRNRQAAKLTALHDTLGQAW